MSLALYPAINLGKTELKIRESISRLSTGLKILGESAGSLSQGITLNAEAKSNQSAILLRITSRCCHIRKDLVLENEFVKLKTV